jgi:copper transport protein
MSPRHRRLAHAAVIALTVVAALALAVPARAHTDLAGSTPADDATVRGSVETVSVTFTGAITPAGDGITVTQADGPVLPVTRLEVDGTTLQASTPPLADGRYTVQWRVTASDGHLLTGDFAFTITGAAADVRRDEAVDAGLADGADDVADGARGVATDREPAADDRAPAADNQEPALDEPQANGADTGAGTAPADGRPVDGTAPIAAATSSELATNWAVDLLVVWIVGSVAFLAYVADADARQMGVVARRTVAAGMLALGAIGAQIGARATAIAGGPPALGELTAAIQGSYGATVALQLGGLFVLLPAVRSLARQVSASEHDAGPPPAAESADDDALHEGAVRVVPAPLVPAAIGATALVLSYTVSGHALIGDAPLLGAIAIALHVAGVAVWIGGLPWMAGLVRHHWTVGTPQASIGPLTRFAQLATGALNLVLVSGAVLAVLRLGALDTLWSTSYGRVLAVKLSVVAVVVLLGAVNHLVLIPRFRRSAAVGRARHIAWFVGVEVTLSVFVLGATTALVHTPPPS